MSENAGIDVDPEPADDPDQIDEGEHDVQEHFNDQQLALQGQLEAPVQNIVVMYQNFINAPMIQMAQLPANGAVNPIEVVPAGDGRDDLEAQVANLRDRVGQLETQQTRTAQCMYLTAAVSLLTGLSTALGIYFSIKSLAGHGGNDLVATAAPSAGLQETDAGPAVPSPDTADAHAITQAWLNSSEIAFWENLALFVQDNGPRPWQEQLLFCQFTEDLSIRLQTRSFIWASPKDKIDLITQSHQVIATQGLAAMYRLMPTLNYDGAALPRAVAANIAALAICAWAREAASPGADAAAKELL